MARRWMPRELLPNYTARHRHSVQELFYRSFHGGDRLSSSPASGFPGVKLVKNSVVSSDVSSLSNTFPAALKKSSFQSEKSTTSNSLLSVSMVSRYCQPHLFTCAKVLPLFSSRSIATVGNSFESSSLDVSASIDVLPRIKFKRLDKTARHIMQILNKEAVEEVRMQREIPDIRPGYIVQIKVEVPENKRRVSVLKGIVIARRNAGLNSTFRVRRLVAGVGIESLFPMYSPNIKEIKVLDKKRVRRAKLYYLRDKMNALKKH